VGEEQTTAIATAKTTADFSTAAASAPPSVEMTWFGWGEEQTTASASATATATATATADFSTAAAKCAAFGRNDGVWVMVRGQKRKEII
jgi:hypothetical protein